MDTTKNRHLALRMLAISLVGGLMLGCITPLKAFASTASTDVSLFADSSQISVTVPTSISYAIRADGTFTTPDPEAATLVNNSIFPIHVSNMSVAVGSGFVLDDSSRAAWNAGSQQNLLWSTVKPEDRTAIDFGDFKTAAQPIPGEWNMTEAGTGGATINLTTAGAIKNITKDLSSANNAFIVTWTVSAGSAS